MLQREPSYPMAVSRSLADRGGGRQFDTFPKPVLAFAIVPVQGPLVLRGAGRMVGQGACPRTRVWPLTGRLPLPDPATKTAGTAQGLPGPFSRFTPEIDDALRRSLDADSGGAYQMLRYAMGWCDAQGRPVDAPVGKMLRPALCLFACEAAGGHPSSAVPAAAALELIHNFSLIHDDIQDRDEVRRHRPTLWAIWGEPKALVAGNTMRVTADLSLWDLFEHGHTDASVLRVADLLTTAYLDMTEGQYMDLEFEGRPDIGLNDYFEMISRKTGALIRCSMSIGAVIGSGDAAVVDTFENCGRSLGLLFQIRDDMLGVWGKAETTGKALGADIRRKKNSLPVVYAMSEAGGAGRGLLHEVYGKPEVTDDDVEAVLGVMEDAGARRYCESLAMEHRDQALEPLRPLELSPSAYNGLEELTSFLVAREY